MRCTRCGVCCTQTEMLLSAQDITRLEKKGFRKNFFTRFDKAGYAVLRNRGGYCVFYDTEKRRCTVYATRPSGCRVYPVIYDEEKGIVADTICRARATVTQQEKQRKGQKVIRLLEKIDAEAKTRSPNSQH